MISFVHKFGILRIILILVAILLVIGGVMAANVGENFDWDRLSVSLVPAFTPIVFTVIVFDMVMSKLRREDTADAEEQSRFLLINRVYTVLMVALVLSWAPFVWSIVKKQL